MSIDDHWAVYGEVYSSTTVDIIVMLQNYEIFPLEVEFRVDELYIERVLMQTNRGLLPNFIVQMDICY